jgi:hypothetical protein
MRSWCALLVWKFLFTAVFSTLRKRPAGRGMEDFASLTEAMDNREETSPTRASLPAQPGDSYPTDSGRRVSNGVCLHVGERYSGVPRGGTRQPLAGRSRSYVCHQRLHVHCLLPLWFSAHLGLLHSGHSAVSEGKLVSSASYHLAGRYKL